jgi:hypothetical protein
LTLDVFKHVTAENIRTLADSPHQKSTPSSGPHGVNAKPETGLHGLERQQLVSPD